MSLSLFRAVAGTPPRRLWSVQGRRSRLPSVLCASQQAEGFLVPGDPCSAAAAEGSLSLSLALLFFVRSISLSCCSHPSDATLNLGFARSIAAFCVGSNWVCQMAKSSVHFIIPVCLCECSCIKLKRCILITRSASGLIKIALVLATLINS